MALFHVCVIDADLEQFANRMVPVHVILIVNLFTIIIIIIAINNNNNNQSG